MALELDHLHMSTVDQTPLLIHVPDADDNSPYLEQQRPQCGPREMHAPDEFFRVQVGFPAVNEFVDGKRVFPSTG